MITSASVPTIRGDNLDILRELGLTEAKQQYNQRVGALVDPGAYATARNAQVVLMENAVKASYDLALADLKKTGMPSHQAQELAILSSVQTKNVQEKILESLFPSGSNAIAMQSSARVAGKFTGMLEAPSATPTPRAAPRRRAAAQTIVVAMPAAPAKKKRATKKK